MLINVITFGFCLGFFADTWLEADITYWIFLYLRDELWNEEFYIC